ncbi:MAG: response regulator, partial [Acidobacteria bacterium]|nr:response regulator [Acidobacteriota bacterium]
ALLLSELPEDAFMRSQVDEIHRAAERASVLNQQLLAFSDKPPHRLRALDLNAVVRGMYEMLRHLAGGRAHLDLDLDPGLGFFRADQSQIEQVLVNLVLNARDAMPTGGRITITTAGLDLDGSYEHQYIPIEPGPFVMLAVSDTGCAMDERRRARIFEPFFTTKPKSGGTGPGLSIVYGIVKQHGGDIQVHSAVGQGTTLRIYLPRVEDLRELAAPPLGAEPRRSGAETVLLVDDEEKVRSVLREIPETDGYRALEAADGRVALLVASRHNGPIHLLVTDVVLPDMSGLDLVGNLATLRPEMKVLYMSGYADARYGILPQSKTFLEKPFTPERLTHRVREVLGAPGCAPGAQTQEASHES